MHTSIVRVFAVTLIAAGSFTSMAARPSHQSASTLSAAPGGKNPGIPIPVCSACGRGNAN